MNAEVRRGTNKLTLEIDMNEKLQSETHSRYNMGLRCDYEKYIMSCELDRFFNNKARHETF